MAEFVFQATRSRAINGKMYPLSCVLLNNHQLSCPLSYQFRCDNFAVLEDGLGNARSQDKAEDLLITQSAVQYITSASILYNLLQIINSIQISSSLTFLTVYVSSTPFSEYILISFKLRMSSLLKGVQETNKTFTLLCKYERNSISDYRNVSLSYICCEQLHNIFSVFNVSLYQRHNGFTRTSNIQCRWMYVYWR